MEPNHCIDQIFNPPVYNSDRSNRKCRTKLHSLFALKNTRSFCCLFVGLNCLTVEHIEIKRGNDAKLSW